MMRIKQKIKLVKKQALVCLAFGCLAIVFAFGGQVAWAEWREPAAAPPQENPYPPISIGAESQVKEGYLRLDPTYNPDNLSSSVFYPLEVVGTGAKFIETVADDLEAVDTLYVDKINQRVGIGTATPTAKLSVVNGTVKVGISTDPVTGQAVNAFSSDNYAISGTTSAAESAGVYGITTNSAGYGVLGVSDSSGASGVYGSSVDGYGVYGRTNSYANAAVYGENISPTSVGWAGYFDGPLGAGGDVVSSRFLPTNLQTSLVPFTAGQKAGYYQVSDSPIGSPTRFSMTFDSSYLWVANKAGQADGKNLFKVQASDGRRIASYEVSGTQPTPYDLAFDGQYIWATSTGTGDNSLLKIDPLDGSVITYCSTLGAQSNWGSNPQNLTVSDIDGQIYIWTANPGGADVTKFDRDCNQIGVYPIGTTGAGNDQDRLNDDGWRMKPLDIIFADGYIWTVSPSVCGTTPPYIAGSCTYSPMSNCYGTDTCQANDDNLIKIDPSTGSVVARYQTGLQAPARMIFDGSHIWVIPSSSTVERKISKVRPADGLILATLDLPGTALDLAFDGTYVWVAHVGSGNVNTGILTRIAVHNNEMKDYPSLLSTNYWNGRLLFDSTYLWLLSSCNDPSASTDCGSGGDKPLRLTKIYSGTGLGHTDLSTVVNLNPASAQSGNINITGSAEIGSDVTVGGDIDVPGNFWAGSDETVPVSGTATCSNGSYIKGVIIDAAGKLDDGSIICRGLQ